MLLTVGGVVVGVVIAALTPGMWGHLLALVVWAAAAWSCLAPARARAASVARTWARVGAVVFTCFATFAGVLAVSNDLQLRGLWLWWRRACCGMPGG